MEMISRVFIQVATTSAAQFTPNFQNFAEAFASTRHVFEVIERVSQTERTVEIRHGCL